MKTELMFYITWNLSNIMLKLGIGSIIHLTLISVIDILETHLPLAAYTGVF